MYKSYTHIERLDKPDCEGLLQNLVYISAKIDGTNACVWSDDGLNIQCGSRKREINPDKDNAGFAEWILHSGDKEAVLLRTFVRKYPGFIVYGEWMGSNFVGHIKDYNKEAKGHMYIFDVYSTLAEQYLADLTWRALLAEEGLEEYFVELLAVEDHPSIDRIVEIAKNNRFLLDDANHAGEGVVIKAPGWKNVFGHFCYGKFVLDEYIQNKSKKKKSFDGNENVEESIVDLYLTDAEMAKAVAKTKVQFDEEKFDNHSGKMIGFYLNMIWKDAILEECGAWVKKFHNPIVNFSLLNALAKEKAKKYIGL